MSDDKRLVNVCGVEPDLATLATSERLVASFVEMAVQSGRQELAAGAAVALLCFTSPHAVGDELGNATVDYTLLMQEFVDAGMSEVTDILDATQVAIRLSALTRGMRNKEVIAMLRQTVKKGEDSRASALRATEVMVMEAMAK